MASKKPNDPKLTKQQKRDLIRAENRAYKYRLKDAARKKADKERDKVLKGNLARLKKIGLYNPVQVALTDYRRRRVRELTKEFGHLADSASNFFVSFTDVRKPARKRILQRAKELGMQTSPKGVFVSREKDSHKFTKIKRVYNKRAKRYEFKLTRRQRSGQVETFIIPVAHPDDLARNYDRLKQLLHDNPINSKQRYRFIINLGVNPGNISKRAFSNIDQLWTYLLQYRDKEADQVELIENIAVVIVNGGGPTFRKVVKVLEDDDLTGEE